RSSGAAVDRSPGEGDRAGKHGPRRQPALQGRGASGLSSSSSSASLTLPRMSSLTGVVSLLRTTTRTRTIAIRGPPGRMRQEMLRIGVIGMRGIGNTHAEVYHNNSLAELVGVCDIARERADESASRWGVPAYYSVADLLREARPDTVSVTTGGF